MKRPKCKTSAPVRSSTSAPVLSPALPAVPVWVSHTQVPDNPPSAHYPVSPSHSTSLVFDPWKRFDYDDPQKTPSKKKVIPCEELRENTARSSGRATPSALLVWQRKVLMSALAIVACVMAFLVTSRGLGISDKHAGGGIERLTAPVTNVTAPGLHLSPGSSGEGGPVHHGSIGGPAKGAKRRANVEREKTGEITHRFVNTRPQSILESTQNGDFSSYSAHPDLDT
ncbi:hypothetical protein HPB51_019064 [Rhipicephalus microplus]|uniref:Uncharacterized protein n=1 Tax=Rhipicephalus microplus TaxID=6941 RepID=A0A9J6D6S0_RHIMP|nr:hypothetical protein HPB51_019064 [Rhipicephalus microplus]